MKETIGVIGCGNMASAIITGISKKYPEIKFKCFTPSYTRAEALAIVVNGEAVKDLKQLQDCDRIIIACKPQQFNELAQNLRVNLSLDEKHIVSIMAATKVENIVDKLGINNITRVMPNTPSFYNEGISLLYHHDNVNEYDKDIVKKIFEACSQCFLIKSERNFDKITTISGSGPAYIFYMTHLLSEKLSSWGVDADDANKMAIQLLKGSSILMENRGEDNLSQLIEKVTSKKGVTIEAMESFREQDLRGVFDKALKAACRRTDEISREMS